MRIEWRRPDVLVLDDVFDETEIEILTSVASTSAFEEQELGRGIGASRSRERAQVESAEVANILWWHLAEHVRPLSRWFEGQQHGISVYPGLEDWVPYACNERSRIYRYGLGADFREHEDEAWRPKRSVRSFLTVLVYMPTEERCGRQAVVMNPCLLLGSEV